MKPKSEFKNGWCLQFKQSLAVRAGVLLLCLTALVFAFTVPARAETQTAAIPFSDIGAKATVDYKGDALGITAASDGARLRCDFQKLEGYATTGGLWLESTEPGAAGKFRLVATTLRREGNSTVHSQPAISLPATGTVSVEDKLVRFTRPGVTEEYSVSVDGVRQDFVIAAPPAGAGDLRLELALGGARAEAMAGGAKLKLDGSGRALVYSRLRVEDAEGRELTARLEVLSADRLAVSVADGNATYPVRIDPTFSDTNWVSLGSGMSSTVVALAVSGTNLYAGGIFTNAGGVAANRIAKWDGSAWSALGSGISTTTFPPFPVTALAVSGTNLYAGGNFTAAGGVPAIRIAKWDGNAWSALGSGMNSDIDALAVSGTNLYAGGYFTMAGGVSTTNIAKWDGSTWSALGSGLNGGVLVMAVNGTDLYAAGSFSTAGGVPANHIAKWNGSAWSALGTGFSGTVYALAVSGTDLYAGGYFTAAGGIPATNVAKWDGNTWSALGSGLGPPSVYVYALAVSGTKLYAGGGFTTAGGVTVNHIAKWVGNSWSALGSGVNGGVSALAADGAGHLFVGGGFTLAGTNVSPYIAQANIPSVPGIEILRQPQSQAVRVGATVDFMVVADAFPSPQYQWFFNGTNTISTATNPTATNSLLHLVDVQFSQSGAYTVVVTNDSGSVTSSVAILTVEDPFISSQPAGQSVDAGETVAFSVDAGGTPPLSCQWFRDGAIVNNGGHISGAQTFTLTLTNVIHGDAGGYSFVISNVCSSVTSSVAILAVADPFIVSQPASQSVDEGDIVAFHVIAGGTPPFHYQWRKNSAVLTNSTSSTLNFDPVQMADTATYDVVVTNTYGSVTSAVAVLSVYPSGSHTVKNCTEANLRAAMALGGTVEFACDGTIYLTDTIIVGTNTVLDGTGHAVTISGCNSVRVFTVNSSLTVVNLTIAHGHAPNGSIGTEWSQNGGPGTPGGGIYNSGTLILRDCLVTANSAGNGGYGYTQTDGRYGVGGAGAAGGGIYNAGNLTLSNCIVAGNSAGFGGSGGTTIQGTYYGLGGNGGGGGGIYNAGSLQLYNSTISGNSAGDGAYNPMRGPGANGGAGGGICGGNLTANSCTFSFNSAGNGGHGGGSDLNGGEGGNGGLGGAIYGMGSMALTNCTFGGNSAGQAGAGGGGGNPPFGSSGPAGQAGTGAGIYSQASPVLVNCTITSNRIGGGVVGTARLLNTIVALNSGNPPDVSGAFLSLGHNLIGATNGSSGFPMSGDLVGSSAFPLDPELGPLTNNGGPTLTMALLPGSPAIDAGDNASAPATDQRGVVRPYGVACDIGAYEYNIPNFPIIATAPATQTAEAGGVVNLAANVTGYPPPTFQWFFNGNVIVGCTNCFLCLSGVQATNVGVYTLFVSNIVGVVTSSPAMLNVIPVVERRPVPGVEVAGEAGSLLNVDYANSLNPSPNWTALGSVTLTSTSQFCPDLTMPLPTARFYRAWQTGTPSMVPTLNLNFVPAIKLTGNVGDSLRLDCINAIGPTNAWVTLDTVTLTNTSQLYFDVTAPGQPQRLYRIVPAP
jgi:hypothetical protein